MSSRRKSSSSTKEKVTSSVRKSPRKSGKQRVQTAQEDENITSSYFNDTDNGSSDLDDSSNDGNTRRKSIKSKVTAKKATSNKKSKLEQSEDDDYSESGDVGQKKTYDSDALDEESDFDGAPPKRKRGRVSTSAPKKTSSPRKKKQKKGDDEEEFEDLDLADGQEVVGVVVQAPTKGHVPPGQISQNTLNFLTELKKPECNDRQWFKLHEPVYRLAETEWKDFIEHFTDVLVEVDPQIPHLPPKDVIHRIYRDIRFSNDKTPYKAGFSASFSRSGRKGIFAHYHIAVKPGNESLIAAGSWCPGRNELATIRANIQRNPSRLRDIISDPEFVKFFGKPKPHPNGQRQNIFGGEDELKTAPKGVAKDHKDIDLLKCRSFAVIHRFADAEVLDPDFKHTLAKVAKVMQPFVHTLNDMMTIAGATNNNANGGDEEDDADGGDDEE